MPVTKKQLTDCEEVLTELFKRESFINNIASAFSKVIRVEIDEMKDQIKALEDKFESLKHEVIRAKSDNTASRAELEEKVDRLDQYTRRNCIRIYGVAETNDENPEEVIVNTIQEKMNIKVLLNEIERCYRIGRNEGRKIRPIIIKFASYKTKEKIFVQKKVLKGSGITIGEDLTRHRYSEMQRLRVQYGKTAVWSRDGSLFVEDTDGQKKKILS